MWQKPDETPPERELHPETRDAADVDHSQAARPRAQLPLHPDLLSNSEAHRPILAALQAGKSRDGRADPDHPAPPARGRQPILLGVPVRERLRREAPLQPPADAAPGVLFRGGDAAGGLRLRVANRRLPLRPVRCGPHRHGFDVELRGHIRTDDARCGLPAVVSGQSPGTQL